MRVAFLGTPEFAVPSLGALAERHDVVLVVTRPDAVRSRGRSLEPSPVKARAIDLGLPVLETSRMTPDAVDALRCARPDVVCVAAFGCILPDPVLDVAPLGCVNVHASLLPRWRGAAPVQRAILAGDERVGVSIMRMVHGIDAGSYCRQASLPVGSTPCARLMSDLAAVGATELVLALDEMGDGTAVWTEQDEGRVTLAPKVGKSEMHLDPADPAPANARRVQASTDAAPARAVVCGRGLRVVETAVADADVPSGAVARRGGRVLLGCSDGSLRLLRVKPDGRREMDALAWASGLRDVSPTWGRP